MQLLLQNFTHQSFRFDATIAGTQVFMSPAIIDGLNKGEVVINHNLEKSDIFSAGLTIYCAYKLLFPAEIRDFNNL